MEKTRLEDERKKDIAMPPLDELGTGQVEEPVTDQVEEAAVEEQPVAESSQEVAKLVNDPSPEETQPKSQQEINFKTLRDNSDRLERERNEAIAKLSEYERQKVAIAPTVKESDDYGLGIGDDDLAEGKHLNKINAHIKKLEEQVNNYQRQSSEIGVETKLKQRYADFDKVVSKENIDLLRSLHPEIAQTINSSSDLYSKAVSAYTMIKKLGIIKEDSFQQDRELAQKNTAKPKPLTSVSPQQGNSPLSNANAFANGLTDDLKKQLYREMIDAAKKS